MGFTMVTRPDCPAAGGVRAHSIPAATALLSDLKTRTTSHHQCPNQSITVRQRMGRAFTLQTHSDLLQGASLDLTMELSPAPVLIHGSKGPSWGGHLRSGRFDLHRTHAGESRAPIAQPGIVRGGKVQVLEGEAASEGLSAPGCHSKGTHLLLQEHINHPDSP